MPLGVSEEGFVTYLLARLARPTVFRHGTFDKNKGVFTVQTAGMYLFQLEGLPVTYEGVKVQLMVNGIAKAQSYSYICEPASSSQPPKLGAGSLSISCFLHLRNGDQVGIVMPADRFCEDKLNNTHFRGVLVAADVLDRSILE